jgi:hypothetical protein
MTTRRRGQLRNGAPPPDHPSPQHTAAMPVGRGAPFLLLATGNGLVLICPWARPRQRCRLTDQQIEAIAGVQDRLAASSAWVGADPFQPISPAWIDPAADHGPCGGRVAAVGVTDTPGGSLGPR